MVRKILDSALAKRYTYANNFGGDMAGTRTGGLKAAAINKERYGSGVDGKENFYSSIGRKGGRISRGGGFALTGDPQIDAKRLELAKAAGHKGGTASRRGPNKTA